MNLNQIVNTKNILMVVQLILSILSLMGLVYLTQFTMKSKLVDGKRCIDMTKQQVKLAKLTVVLLWVSVITLLFFGTTFLMFLSGSVREMEKNITGFADSIASNSRSYTIAGVTMFVLAVIQMFALVQLTKFVFYAKEKDGKLCIEMSQNDLNLTKVGVSVVWVGVGVSVLQSLLTLVNNQTDLNLGSMEDYNTLV